MPAIKISSFSVYYDKEKVFIDLPGKFPPGGVESLRGVSFEKAENWAIGLASLRGVEYERYKPKPQGDPSLARITEELCPNGCGCRLVTDGRKSWCSYIRCYFVRLEPRKK